MFNHKKVVMITPERLGDTLMCTPAIHYFKYHYPDVQIHIIALSELSADVLKNNPDIHRVSILPPLRTLNSPEHQYDFAINLHDGDLARDYLKALNIPVEHIPPIDPNIHQAEQALQFVKSLTPTQPEILERNYRIFPPDEDKIYIETLLKAHRLDLKKDILIGIHPGCHSLAKKRFVFFKKMTHPKIWPFEYIIELVQTLYQKRPDIKIIITGSKSELKLGKKAAKLSPNIINLIDQTTVPQLYALMKNLKVFISPDTGLMHVACSSEVPLIALFGPTQLTRTGPYPRSSKLTLLQAPVVTDISVDTVFEALMQKLAE